MIPLSLTLTGFRGIRDGMGRESITIDFEREAGGAALVALTGRNGRGKSTILDNMTPYPVMPSRAGTDGLGAFSYYDEVYLPESHKVLEWSMAGVRYRSHLVIRTGGKRRTEAYLHRLGEHGWTPAGLTDGTVSDGKMETYARCVEGIAGSATTFFSTAFSAQQRRQLSSYRNGEIKHLLTDLLRLDAVRSKGEQAAEVMRLLRAGLLSARQQLQVQNKRLAELGAERDGLGDTAAKAALALRSREVAAARWDAKRTALAALRTEQAMAAGQESRRAQLLAERDTALAAHRRAVDLLEAERRREEAAFDGLATRQAQRATRRETTLASLRAQRTTLQASLEQADRARRAAKRLPAAQTAAARREATLRAKQEGLHAAEGAAAQMTLAGTRQAALEREAGQAALKAQELRRRFSLTGEVPCSGLALQGECKLLADAHTAKVMLPDAGAVVARLNAAHAKLESEIAALRPLADAVQQFRVSVREADGKLARSQHRAARYERQAATCELLARQRAMLTDVELRLTSHQKHCAIEQAEEEKEYGAQRRRIVELNERRRVAAQPSAAVQSIDKLLAELPPAFDKHAIAVAERDCELTGAHVKAAEQAQLAALREHDRAADLARRHAAEREACEHLEHRLAVLERRMEDWSLLSKALGNDGIIALAIDDAGPELSMLANQLLLACYGPRFSVSIKTQLATAKGELREGFDVAVHDANSDSIKSVARMSGGERIWINECLTRAMALYLAQAGGQRSATLFSDEADGAFDAQHKRQFMAMKREVVRVGGYTREFFISHSQELADAADATINLERYAS